MEKPSGSNTNKQYRLTIGMILLGSFLFSFFLFFLFPNLLEIWHSQINDQLFRLRYFMKGKEKIYPSIVHIDLNDSDYQQFKLSVDRGHRGLYAEIIHILTASFAHTIGVDVTFEKLYGGADDQALVVATQKSGKVYYPVILIPEDHRRKSEPWALLPAEEEILKKNLWHPAIKKEGKPLEANYAIPTPPDLSTTAKGLGNITCYPDKGGVYRRFPLIIKYHDGYFPSLGFRMVCDYLNVLPEQIEIEFGKQILLPGAHFPEGFTKDIAIPIDQQGRMTINFAGPWADSFIHYSFGKLAGIGSSEDLLDVLRDEMEGNIAVVADASTRGGDIGSSPLEMNYPLSGLHSNVINSILTQNFIYELSLGKNILIWLVFVALLWFFALKFRALAFSCYSAILLLLFLKGSCWVFIFQNTIINLVCPSLGFLFSLVTVNTYRFFTEQREKAVMHSKFESYFAPPLLEKILKSPEKLQASERKVLTVLFSDIVGFTSWCTTQEPEQIRATLNEYFDEMTKIVFSYEGTIDKFIGDGLMVFFGDPLEQPDHALRAVKVAREMQKKTRELNKRWSAEGRLPIQIRVGINTGEVVVGNMGSDKRMDYTAIGSNVNLAQRMESQAPKGGILVAESVYEEVKDGVQTKSFGKISAKGFTEEIAAYEIIVD